MRAIKVDVGVASSESNSLMGATNLSAARVPSIFVSSTCYDLAQVRADLRDFIESIGLEPVLSEYVNFPVDPDGGTVENSLQAVDSRADIFLLIVGGRYGSQNEEGKSITNLEYLRAKAKGVPVYAFVLKSIIDILPVWRDNPGSDYRSVADSPKLLEFVQSIRESGNVWVYPFELAQDIINTLRQQLGFLFMDALQTRDRLKGSSLLDKLSHLRGESFRLAVEKPIAWKERLFAQVLADGLADVMDLKRDMEYGVDRGEAITFSSVGDVVNYLQAKMNSLRQVSTGLDQLINQAFKDGIQEADKTGNPEALVYAANRVADAYRIAILWSVEFNRVHAPHDCQELVKRVSNLSTNIIREIEEFSEHMQTELADAVRKVLAGEPVSLDLTLTLTVPDTEPIIDELTRIECKAGR